MGVLQPHGVVETAVPEDQRYGEIEPGKVELAIDDAVLQGDVDSLAGFATDFDRSVLDNTRLKEVSGYRPRKTSSEVFDRLPDLLG